MTFHARFFFTSYFAQKALREELDALERQEMTDDIRARIAEVRSELVALNISSNLAASALKNQISVPESLWRSYPIARG